MASMFIYDEKLNFAGNWLLVLHINEKKTNTAGIALKKNPTKDEG